MSPKAFRALVPVALILGVVVGALLMVKHFVRPHGVGEPGSVAAVGSKLPEFKAEAFPGGKQQALVDLGAKVVVVNFWASWCQACMIEMPSIMRLRAKLKAKGLEVMAINVDENPEAVIPKIVQKLNLDFPIFVDRDATLADVFDVHAIPLTAIVRGSGPDVGKVLYLETGEREWDSVEVVTQVEKWLAQ